jgi:hypothetical protein
MAESDQPRSAHFHALFDSALQAYEKKTDVTLAEHPLALRIQSCRSVDDISTLLQSQAEVVGDLEASDRIMKAIKKTLSIIVPLSQAAAASLPAASGLVSQKPLMPSFAYLTLFDQPLQPAKAIQAGLAILLDVCAVLQLIYRYPCDTLVN